MTFPMLVLKASFLPALVAVLSRVLFFNMDSDSFSFATVEIIKKLRYIDNITFNNNSCFHHTSISPILITSRRLHSKDGDCVNSYVRFNLLFPRFSSTVVHELLLNVAHARAPARVRAERAETPVLTGEGTGEWVQSEDTVQVIYRWWRRQVRYTVSRALTLGGRQGEEVLLFALCKMAFFLKEIANYWLVEIEQHMGSKNNQSKGWRRSKQIEQKRTWKVIAWRKELLS